MFSTLAFLVDFLARIRSWVNFEDDQQTMRRLRKKRMRKKRMRKKRMRKKRMRRRGNIGSRKGGRGGARRWVFPAADSRYSLHWSFSGHLGKYPNLSQVNCEEGCRKEEEEKGGEGGRGGKGGGGRREEKRLEFLVAA